MYKLLHIVTPRKKASLEIAMQKSDLDVGSTKFVSWSRLKTTQDLEINASHEFCLKSILGMERGREYFLTNSFGSQTNLNAILMPNLNS